MMPDTQPPPGYEELLQENARLKSVQPVGQKATTFIVAIICLCAITVVGIVAIQIVRPEADNTPIITAIIGVTAPILVALLAGAVQQVHLAVNSRLSQLLELTAQASRAKGIVIEKERVERHVVDVEREVIAQHPLLPAAPVAPVNVKVVNQPNAPVPTITGAVDK